MRKEVTETKVIYAVPGLELRICAGTAWLWSDLANAMIQVNVEKLRQLVGEIADSDV